LGAAANTPLVVIITSHLELNIPADIARKAWTLDFQDAFLVFV